MVKNALFLVLLSSHSLFWATAVQRIDHKLVTVMSHAPGLFQDQIAQLAKALLIFKYGFYKKSEGTQEQLIRVIPYKGHVYTLKEMVALEAQATDPLERAALAEAVFAYYLQAIAPFLDELKSVKPILSKLITCWAQQNNHPHSILLNWQKHDKDEHIILRQYVTTAAEAELFVDEVLQFVAALAHSIKKN